MRSFEGQHSDNVAIKRSREEKQRQLVQLKEQLATLKAHAAPAIREALVKRIAELDAELRQPAKPPREGREGREDAPRHPRREARPSVFRAEDSGDRSATVTASSVFASPRRRS
ncbi:hypothetical protein J2848_003987 [Azospirillum lipoferum]|uniref:Uncharacterized protein n=1 Tax=Azospirillum lipoferum TaxID=193 RepID=A0A5A9GCK7_AZOLI|nr:MULTISPECIES: hypothetical protein [Azospirillum]KAA0592210.1 hypothetical protein FZ942_28730 [Azospirillum lipoferum]MCP1612307.1 hypothetical protein [Azospirillum lipoferum]MDW5536471.1 hypothetical protein [Azospirillum sp. NL1]